MARKIKKTVKQRQKELDMRKTKIRPLEKIDFIDHGNSLRRGQKW